MIRCRIVTLNSFYYLCVHFLFTIVIDAAKIAITTETTKHILGKRRRFVTNGTIGTLHFHYNKQGGNDLLLPLWLFLCYFEIGFQGFDVGLEGLVAFGGDAADGARTLALEGLFHLDVARL